MAKRVGGKRADGEKVVAVGRKVQAPGTQKPVRRPSRAAGVRRSKPVETEQPAAADAPPAGIRISVDDVTVEADEPQLERSQLRARLSVRRGDQIVYAERVNLDWPGGRDKFLRKASRALLAAGVATRIGDAVLGELRGLLRARTDAHA